MQDTNDNPIKTSYSESMNSEQKTSAATNAKINKPTESLTAENTEVNTETNTNSETDPQNSSEFKSSYLDSVTEGTVDQTDLSNTTDTIRQEPLKAKNRRAADSLVHRMLWQQEEKVNNAVDVSSDGTVELNDEDD